jgi:hypothetical protein
LAACHQRRRRITSDTPVYQNLPATSVSLTRVPTMSDKPTIAPRHAVGLWAYFSMAVGKIIKKTPRGVRGVSVCPRQPRYRGF